MSNHTGFDLILFTLPKKNIVAEKLAVSAAKIAFHNFEWRYVTLVILNALFCGIQAFVEIYDKSVIITNGESDQYSYEDTRQYIVFGTNLTDITYKLEWLNRRKFDNTGKFIIVCNSEISEECNEHDVIDTFWNYKIINVVLLKSELEQISGYTSLHREDCVGNKAVRLNNLTHRNEISNKKNSEVFYQKYFNLQKCPIIVSTFIQPPYMTITDGVPQGVDGDLLRIIAQALNATIEMMTPKEGDGWGSLSDGKWTGSLGDVYNDLANFSMTFPAITLTRFTYFQMSIDYNVVSLVWITHPKETVPPSYKLLYPFQTSTLIALAITFIFVIVSAMFTKSRTWIQFSRKINMAQPQRGLIFYSWMICMGMPSTKFPKKTALLYIVLFWIWYGFFVRTFYQASLINSLKTDKHYSNFDTVYDFLSADYPIGGGTAIRDYYIDDPIVFNNWRNMNISEIFAHITAVSQGQKYGVAVNLEHAITFLVKHRGGLFILPQKIIVSPTAIFFKKFSPLAAPLNRILRRLVEAGIPMKLYKDYSHKLTIAPDTEENKSPIKIEHYTGCYVILFAGWVGALLILKLEICFGRNVINVDFITN